MNGHQSKIIVTDFTFGSKKLLYSTAEVLTYSVIDGKEVLVVWVPTGEAGELVVTGVRTADISKSDIKSATKVDFFSGANNVTISFSGAQGTTVVNLEDGSRVVILDRSAAYQFWVPTLSNDPLVPENDTGKWLGI